MSAPLSKKQKRDLSMLAQRAFNLAGAKARGEGKTSSGLGFPALGSAPASGAAIGAPADGSASASRLKTENLTLKTFPADLQTLLRDLALNGNTACFTTWRHEHVAMACGKHGLRCCSQDDYKKVEAYFLALLGEDGKALNALVRETTNAYRVARHNLEQACRDWNFDLSFASFLCLQIHKVKLDDATPDQLRKTMFTIINRGRARRNKVLAHGHHKEAA